METSVESHLQENRIFQPPADFAAQAHVKSLEDYEALHKRSIEDPEAFWSEQADNCHWFQKWDNVVEWNCPDAKWFVGGKCNLCHNAVDKQVEDGHGDQVALVWESESVDDNGQPTIKRYTYADLQRETARFANVLKSQGVNKGDVVTIYMGMIPELAIAVLACARIGAPHSVIFGGFSSQAIADRVNDCESRVVITADGSWRRGKPFPLKTNVDEACQLTDKVEKVIVYKHTGIDTEWADGRDLDWAELIAQVDDNCPCEPMDSEALAFILYTSGSTGKPKGIMHSTGGYMVHTQMTAKYTFDLKAGDPNEMYWCTADIGWITGHSYILYGVLPNRVPTLMYEGGPNYPAANRFWDMIERHKVSKFYTAPTAIRAFMKWGDEHIEKHDLSSLKVLGTVGEPINPEAWMWYREKIGGGRCPIVDTWWQTETGGHMITPLPGATPTTPGSCTRPMLGIDAAIVDEQGNEKGVNEGGILVIRKPWPSMLRGVYGNRERFVDTYWSLVPGMYTAGDGARKDESSNIWITGRIDDVIVVAGHNVGTMEVESALVSHEAVAEAAVVGYPHELKGNDIAAFVILKGDLPEGEAADTLKKTLIAHCGKQLGPICKPGKIYLAPDLPKTRSGKIMRRLLRDIAAGREITQDTTTLADPGIVDKLQAQG